MSYERTPRLLNQQPLDGKPVEGTPLRGRHWLSLDPLR